MEASSAHVRNVRSNWREPDLTLNPDSATGRAHAAGVSGEDVANTLRFATDGIPGGVYQEGERHIPIVVRLAHDSGLGLMDRVVHASVAGAFLPIEQVIDGFGYEVRNTLVHRRDRVTTLAIAVDMAPGRNASKVHAEIREGVEAIRVTPGYRME